VADENKVQGYVPSYNAWVLKRLAPEHVGTSDSDVISNIVLQWFSDNKRLIRMLRLTEADYLKTLKKGGKDGPRGIVPPSGTPAEPQDRWREAPALIQLRAPTRRGARRR
jgi:hypothetical protein